MRQLRTVWTACSFLIIAVAWGCSSSSVDEAGQPAAAQVSSPNFQEIRPRLRIPPKNTCDGDNLSPPLEWSGAPEGTKSLALIA